MYVHRHDVGGLTLQYMNYEVLPYTKASKIHRTHYGTWGNLTDFDLLDAAVREQVERNEALVYVVGGRRVAGARPARRQVPVLQGEDLEKEVATELLVGRSRSIPLFRTCMLMYSTTPPIILGLAQSMLESRYRNLFHTDRNSPVIARTPCDVLVEL